MAANRRIEAQEAEGGLMDPLRLLTICDTCNFLKISRSHYYNLRIEGVIPPPIYLGKSPRHPRPDIVDLGSAGNSHDER